MFDVKATYCQKFLIEKNMRKVNLGAEVEVETLKTGAAAAAGRRSCAFTAINRTMARPRIRKLISVYMQIPCTRYYNCLHILLCRFTFTGSDGACLHTTN